MKATVSSGQHIDCADHIREQWLQAGFLEVLYTSEGIGTVIELSAVDNGVHRHFFYFFVSFDRFCLVFTLLLG